MKSATLSLRVRKHWPILARAQPPKIAFLFIRKQRNYSLNNSTNMPPIRSRPSRARYYTPPPDLIHTPHTDIKTPSRCGVLYARLFSQATGQRISSATIRAVTGVAERDQSRILASKQVQMTHNIPDSGPDPRGRKPAILRSDTAAIALYLSDDKVDIDDKGKPWTDIAEDAGIELQQTWHFKPPGFRTLEGRTIQRHCKEDEGIINAIAEEEKELTKAQADNRKEFINNELPKRPHSENWKDTAVCDELHFGIGP